MLPWGLLGVDGAYLFVILFLVGAAGTGGWWLHKKASQKGSRRMLGDLSHERSARQEAEEALYSMAHDLKPPLVTLDHLVADLQQEQEDTTGLPGRDVTAAHTRQVVRHMGGLVDQMLEFARGVGGATAQGDASMEATLNDVRDLLRSKCEDKTVRWDIQSGDDVRLKMTPDALRHILLNLVDNAVKYGPDDETLVRVSWSDQGTREKTDGFVLEVADNGAGVPEEYRKQVFGLLARVPDRLGRDLPGCGVGLAMVRRIVQEQGGRVEICDAPEGGALFRVVYPGSFVNRLQQVPVSDPEPDPRLNPKPDPDPVPGPGPEPRSHPGRGPGRDPGRDSGGSVWASGGGRDAGHRAVPMESSR